MRNVSSIWDFGLEVNCVNPIPDQELTLFRLVIVN